MLLANQHPDHIDLGVHRCLNGLTAYVGLLDIGQPKPGETVVVSSAAGGVGSNVGPINFAYVAACLNEGISAVAEDVYLGVASAYVIANVTALISHVPGGLGVIESVVVFLLPGADLIGALVAFRFIYFLLPLALGGSLFVVAEVASRRSRPGSKAATQKSRREPD